MISSICAHQCSQDELVTDDGMDLSQVLEEMQSIEKGKLVSPPQYSPWKQSRSARGVVSIHFSMHKSLLYKQSVFPAVDSSAQPQPRVFGNYLQRWAARKARTDSMKTFVVNPIRWELQNHWIWCLLEHMRSCELCFWEKLAIINCGRPSLKGDRTCDRVMLPHHVSHDKYVLRFRYSFNIFSEFSN